MNSFTTTNIDYLRASRTIETVLVSNRNSQQFFYVYNYEGFSFRVFKTISSIIEFFSENKEEDFYFESDTALDNFFSNVAIQ